MHDFSSSRSQALQAYLRTQTTEAAISFCDFMAAALYHPVLGYYNTKTFQLGERGDFTTATEISPLYAYCFTKPCMDVFKSVNKCHVLELGAGSGCFAHHLMTALHAAGALPDRYYIYDISPTLRKAQQSYLAKVLPQYYDRFIWLEALPAEFEGIIIANEVIDALPVHCFQLEKDGVCERLVGLAQDHFTWTLAPAKQPLQEACLALQTAYALPVGYRSEINLALPDFIHTLVSALKQGVILFADYGYGEREYYHPNRQDGTLTCYYQHQRISNPFLHVGMQDITAHVNFTQVAELAVAAGCQLVGYTSQAAFLLDCDLVSFSQTLQKGLNERECCEMNQALKILTLPTEMGERCKIMALSKACSIKLTGFELQDKKQEL